MGFPGSLVSRMSMGIEPSDVIKEVTKLFN
ncbi:hypothetical protein Vsou_18810 [Vulcanisaeta souniana JCM 11219]|uniref:Uncharacterized protein n=1 Tax=Vulcanisaeta souniana JCM 11219 TaxID=1293586 RepID=A0ABN6SU23_9CREN|nr:hypothetical protein Vsou_18810 [Vulcanisaeta souniana JCM 11219]